MQLLQLNRELLQWLRTDGAWRALPLARRARLHWMAALASLNQRLAGAQLRDAPPLQDPVFVLGPWRSGSTVMHELLVAASGLPTPQTWQCMNAPAFLLSRPPAAGRREARPMDGLTVGADSPQEDEFALLSLGADSLYRAFWQPARSAELLPLLRAGHWQEQPQWLAPWERFLQGVLQSLGRPGEALLLKSPNHSLRWAALRQRFPQARAVWMLRDAAAVYHSNLKMWRQMVALHGLTPAPEGVLEALIADALQALAAALESAMRDARPPHLVWQQRLREAPRELLVEVCAALQLPCTQGAAFDQALEQAAQGRADRYEGQQLPAAAAAAVARLDAVQAAAWDQQASARR